MRGATIAMTPNIAAVAKGAQRGLCPLTIGQTAIKVNAAANTKPKFRSDPGLVSSSCDVFWSTALNLVSTPATRTGSSEVHVLIVQNGTALFRWIGFLTILPDVQACLFRNL